MIGLTEQLCFKRTLSAAALTAATQTSIRSMPWARRPDEIRRRILLAWRMFTNALQTFMQRVMHFWWSLEISMLRGRRLTIQSMPMSTRKLMAATLLPSSVKVPDVPLPSVPQTGLLLASDKSRQGARAAIKDKRAEISACDHSKCTRHGNQYGTTKTCQECGMKWKLLNRGAAVEQWGEVLPKAAEKIKARPAGPSATRSSGSSGYAQPPPPPLEPPPSSAPASELCPRCESTMELKKNRSNQWLRACSKASCPGTRPLPKTASPRIEVAPGLFATREMWEQFREAENPQRLEIPGADPLGASTATVESYVINDAAMSLEDLEVEEEEISDVESLKL